MDTRRKAQQGWIPCEHLQRRSHAFRAQKLSRGWWTQVHTLAKQRKV